MSNYNRGRGSNPRSKRNLLVPKAKWYVFERGAGIGWSVFSGPHIYAKANEICQRLEKFNHTGQPLYGVSTAGGIVATIPK